MSKKRYVGQTLDEKGVFGKKLTKRGIVLQRRDNCPFLRSSYEMLINYILLHFEEIVLLNKQKNAKELMSESKELRDLLTLLTDRLNEMFAMKFNYKDFAEPEPEAFQPIVEVKAIEQTEPFYNFSKPKKSKPENWQPHH